MGTGRISIAFAAALGVAAFGTGAAIAAGGPETAGSSEAQPLKSKNDTSKRICRNIVQSGTRMSTRYCRTQAEWDRAAEKNQEFLLQGQMNGQHRDGDLNNMGRGG